MQLKFGSYPVVIVSSAEMAKQILRTNDHIFASRPQTAAGKYTTYYYSNVTWAPYGAYWRQGRKIYLHELFSSKRLDSYHDIRVEEMRAFVSPIHALSVTGKPILLKDHLSGATLSIISRIVLGKKYFITESESESVSERYVKRMKALKVKWDRFHDHVLGEHKAKKAEVKNFVPKDMVDLLLQLADDPELEVKLNNDSVKGFIQVILLFVHPHAIMLFLV
ncbi:flavonoid 3-hydroxylase, putative [Ricinus communis]|uniref:Flavonoid 3-hydroxylase, putative n=1 Tax=Ricinus communis TaxID=3988 RepID=B9TJ16_RICCO|nr:flavonoid 3-hydroxylase, putative [Ricinus communis]